MFTKQEFLTVNADFYDVLTTEDIEFGKLLPYEPYSIPSNTGRGGSWMIFHMMAEDYVLELLNNTNQFSSKGLRLAAWTRVLDERVDEQKRLSVLTEIVNPIF